MAHQYQQSASQQFCGGLKEQQLNPAFHAVGVAEEAVAPVQPAPVQLERSDRGSVSEQPDGSGIEALARQLMAGQLAVTALPAGLSAESLCALFEVISQARHGQDGRLLREAVRDTLADDRADAASTLRQALRMLRWCTGAGSERRQYR